MCLLKLLMVSFLHTFQFLLLLLNQVYVFLCTGDLKAGDVGIAAIPGREKEFRESLETCVDYCKALACKR